MQFHTIIYFPKKKKNSMKKKNKNEKIYVYLIMCVYVCMYVCICLCLDIFFYLFTLPLPEIFEVFAFLPHFVPPLDQQWFGAFLSILFEKESRTNCSNSSSKLAHMFS